MTKKTRKDNSKDPSDLSINQAIVSLETKSTRALNSLDRSCEYLRQLEDDLEHFLTDYYDQVGGYFEELEEIENELALFRASLSKNMPIAKRIYDEMEVMPKRESQQLDRDARSLYREMAKECHPDVASGTEAVEQIKDDVIKTLNEAYSRKNLGDLWKIRFEMEEKKAQGTIDPNKRVDLLKERVDQMQRALGEVESRRVKLEESPACALMQRAFQMRLCGQDFIEMVIADVQGQIARKRKELVGTKVRHLYMEARDVREHSHHSHEHSSHSLA